MPTGTTDATPPALAPAPPIRTARITGLLYLGLGITGMLGFLLIRSRLFAPEDPAATSANLIAHEGLARAGIALEMGVVLTQALVALWFWRLFRTVDAFAAGAIATFGLLNAAAALGGVAALAGALQTAVDQTGDASDVQLLYVVSTNFWGVGSLFFGLWLIPMGWCVLRSGWMPRPLGWFLITGGVGYVLSAYAGFLAPGTVLVSVLVVPATIGEFWMIGYLLTRGVRRPAPVASH